VVDADALGRKKKNSRGFAGCFDQVLIEAYGQDSWINTVNVDLILHDVTSCSCSL
jgi:hypothetical protein